MKDISFKTYQNNILAESNAKTLFNNKKVLVCSIMPISGKGVADLYLKHLADNKKKYNSLGIDEIYVVNSSDHIWLLPKVSAFFPELIPLFDYEKKFIRYIEKKYSAYNINFNCVPYQLLITNGIVEKMYTSTSKNFVCYNLYKKLLSYARNNLSKISTVNLKKYKSLRQQILIEGINRYVSSLRDKDQKYYDYKDIEYAFDRAFFYYDIWPNTSLQEYLEKENKITF
jgi:peroxiredoxin